MRHISNYSSSQSMSPTEILQVGTSLKISPHKEPPPPHHTHTHMEKIASKGKNKAPQMEKKGPHSIVVSKGGRAPTLAPLLRAPMSECDYIKCTMFSEIIHHIIISKYTLECTQLNYLLKIFLEEHALESSVHCPFNISRDYFWPPKFSEKKWTIYLLYFCVHFRNCSNLLRLSYY